MYLLLRGTLSCIGDIENLHELESRIGCRYEVPQLRFSCHALHNSRDEFDGVVLKQRVATE
jgi:hypothetical protein